MMHNDKISLSPFPLIIALMGYGLAGILLQGSWLLGLTFFYGVSAPWTDWLFTALAGVVAGLTTARVLEQSLGIAPNRLRSSLVAGWTIIWLITHMIHFSLLGSGLSAAGITTVINILEGLFIAALMAAALNAQNITENHERPWTMGSTFWPWLVAYGLVILFYRFFVPDFGYLTPADVPLILFFSVLGNLIVGLGGTYLTVRQSAR